eukprot:6199908-Pleurochrysis_carterae.AAC.1
MSTYRTRAGRVAQSLLVRGKDVRELSAISREGRQRAARFGRKGTRYHTCIAGVRGDGRFFPIRSVTPARSPSRRWTCMSAGPDSHRQPRSNLRKAARSLRRGGRWRVEARRMRRRGGSAGAIHRCLSLSRKHCCHSGSTYVRQAQGLRGPRGQGQEHAGGDHAAGREGDGGVRWALSPGRAPSADANGAS